jgi:hypothetical protein
MVKMKEQSIIKHLKFPFSFDEKKLVSDLSSILTDKWIPHFNKNGYTGNWKAISLYAKEGNAAHIFALPNDDTILTETPVLKNCLYIKELINSFKFPITSARILKLDVGAVIKPHRDHELGYEDGTFRLHIPITTNEKVSFILDGVTLKMLPGECWYTNVNYVHSVANKGNTDRIHLVIDGKRNAWSDNLFFSQASEKSLTSKPEEILSSETIKRMLEELANSKHLATKNLVADLQEKLNLWEQKI